MQIVVWFWRIRPDVKAEEFERFLREVEHPTIENVPSVGSFQSICINGLTRGDDDLPYDYIDLAEITDIESYRTEMKTHSAVNQIQGEIQKYAEPLGNFWGVLIEE